MHSSLCTNDGLCELFAVSNGGRAGSDANPGTTLCIVHLIMQPFNLVIRKGETIGRLNINVARRNHGHITYNLT